MSKDPLSDLQKKIIEFRDERDWKQFHNPKDSAISLVLEATEFLEHFQWKNCEECTEHVCKKKEDVSDELADVLYWVLLIANDLDIDLYEASLRKLAKNHAKYDVKKAKGNHKKYTEL
ncbi:nucleotide pyrophosphohydrolase [Candidatus Saccharibacteria bacterium]|nr:nucleotide pyrophosphohydrolase [Candidatus Saccharibacteria bacterium]